MRHAIDSRFAEVGRLLDQASAASIPDEIQATLFRHAAVRICGCIERSIEIIILERLKSRAHPRVVRFIEGHFKRGINFECGAVEELLGRFDPEWRRAFCDRIENDPAIPEGVSSCYAVRNSVAHGGTQSVGSKRIRELLGVARLMIDAVIEATDPGH